MKLTIASFLLVLSSSSVASADDDLWFVLGKAGKCIPAELSYQEFFKQAEAKGMDCTTSRLGSAYVIKCEHTPDGELNFVFYRDLDACNTVATRWKNEKEHEPK